MQLTIAIAQLKPRKGAYEANLARLGEVFGQLGALSPRPDVLVLPETALTGYFLEGGVREVARTAGELAADLQRTYVAACGPDAPPRPGEPDDPAGKLYRRGPGGHRTARGRSRRADRRERQEPSRHAPSSRRSHRRERGQCPQPPCRR